MLQISFNKNAPWDIKVAKVEGTLVNVVTEKAAVW